jgi:hypothetical protein
MIREWLGKTELFVTIGKLRNGHKQNSGDDLQDCPMVDGDKREGGDKERTDARSYKPPSG